MDAVAVAFGQGILITTLFAEMDLSKTDFILRVISTLVLPRSATTGNILKGQSTFSVILYDMSSNSPSGGMNVMARSCSNFDSRTH